MYLTILLLGVLPFSSECVAPQRGMKKEWPTSPRGHQPDQLWEDR